MRTCADAAQMLCSCADVSQPRVTACVAQVASAQVLRLRRLSPAEWQRTGLQDRAADSVAMLFAVPLAPRVSKAGLEGRKGVCERNVRKLKPSSGGLDRRRARYEC